MALAWALAPAWTRAANPDGDLRIEPIAAYNFVVDSNVESPSTYAPRAAYLSAKFHNDGTNAITNVWAYIGDYTNGTPGTYPSRAQAPYDGPLPDDKFALWHEGGAAGTADATRYLGTILPGESKTVYWLVGYPNLDEQGKTVTGGVKPNDDLFLQYGIWGTAMDAGVYRQADVTRTVTMRNEISAMANKIFPNGANKVPQEYKDLLALYEPSWTNTASDGSPGTVIATEGVWYDLGNVGAGFDNNGDLIPDRNAWLQPVGDAALFDSSCFRLVHTYALVIVKLNDGTEVIYNVEDQLYFENIPENNRGAVGYVRYEFMAMRSGCSSTLTPYQEVASGYDNEKFNGDYGAFLGQGLTSLEAHMEVTKSVDNPFVAPGEVLSYTIAFTNPGPVTVGDPAAGSPLVMREKIPHGTTYIGLSSSASNTLPGGVSTYTFLYSTNNGATWQETEPADPTKITDVQWWLSDPLGTNVAGSVKLQVTVTTNAGPFITNRACATIAGAGELDCGETTTYVRGTNSLGDLVWADDGAGGGILGNQLQDGDEAGISNVAVRLYYDANANGAYDAGDLLYGTTSTATNGAYMFTNLPDGRFVAVVDMYDSDLPTGYSPTTPTSFGADLDAAGATASPVSFLDADFGFAPALTLTKTHVSTNAVREGQFISYNLTVSNNLPGNGEGGTYATTYAWATNGAQSGTEWIGHTNVYIPPGQDGLYASNNFSGASKILFLTNFPGFTSGGAITNVELVMPIIGAAPATFSQNGTLLVEVQQIAPAATIYSATYRATNTFTNTALQTWTLPMTGTFAWAGTDFATNYRVVLTANKNAGGAGTGYLQVDAVGFRITSVSTGGTGSASTTLQPVPLTDQYDADKFQFVSANPPQTTSTTNGAWPETTGTLFWSNVGPILPGGTSTVAVTFKLLKPETYTNMLATNVTWVTNATFLNGIPANMATSSVVVAQLPAATLGDYVWRDLNGDGVQDPGEPGVANVAVSITPPADIDLGNGLGQPITNWTDAAGQYLFESIPSTGVYTVRVVTATLPGGSGINTYDERGAYDSTAAIYLDVFAAPSSTNNFHDTTDFGYQLGSTIEGAIWHDWDRGGETNREPGETWLTNVTVYLCAGTSPCGAGSALATNVTSTNGYFRFVGAYDGTYNVSVATNTGMLGTGDWNLSWDTDGTNTANVATFGITNGGLARADFSYWQVGPYEIGDTLFYDWDGNGLQSNDWEVGIADVAVQLYSDVNGNGVYDPGLDALVGTTTTSANGTYLFTNLFATNTYFVRVDLTDPDLPPLYNITADPDAVKDARGVVTITNADNYLQDFGFQPYGTGAIGDTVWRDINADGIQSGVQETGISNVLVSLYVDLNGNGNYVLLRTTNTSSTGTYLFTNLPDGNYRVVVDAADADLPQDAFGNIFYPSTATTNSTTIAGGNTYLDADFGFAPYAAIGDTIFWDANRNGTQDYSEEGVEGVTVNLYRDENGNGVYDAGDTFLTSAVTDANGIYLFSGLMPGSYVVAVDGASGPLVGAFLSADPDSNGLTCDDPENPFPCDGEHGRSLVNGQNYMGADFGYVPPGAVIGDTIWIDTDNDGVRDGNESGIAYISVVLWSNGVAIATNETDGDGWYYFSNLGDGDFHVVVDTGDDDFPPGLTQTYDPDGNLDGVGTNVVVSGGAVTSVGGVPCTGCDFSIDFGYRYAGNNSLSGTIGMDATPYDGVLNGTNWYGVATNEIAYANVQVYLYLWNDDLDGIVEPGEYVLVSSTFTSTNGDYSFAGLPTGDGDDQYIVASLAPEDYLKLTTTNGSISGVGVAETANPQGNTDSAYLTVPIQVGVTNYYGNDFAYRSTKVYDYGDLPDGYQTTIPGGARHMVTYLTNLYLGAGVDVEANGVPSTLADGDDLAGTDDEDGVDILGRWAPGTDGGTVEVTVGKGTGWLLGFIDFAGDGDFTDSGDLAVNQAVATNGGPGLDGVYEIPLNVPLGSLSTTNSTVLYARFRLFPSAPFLPELAYSGTADNGEVEDYRWILHVIRGTVFADADVDSDFSGGDTIIPGTVVHLYDDLDNRIASTVTDLSGNYAFVGLQDGNYRVEMETPAGTTAILDRDDNSNGATNIEVTVSGASVFTRDFLVDNGASLASISGTVYEDDGYGVVGDGTFDPPNDLPVPGTTVALYRDIDGDGVADLNEWMAEVVTDVDGFYAFNNLPDGDYLVVMTTPAGATSITDVEETVQLNGPTLIEVPLAGVDVIDRNFLVDGAPPASLSGLIWFDSNRNGIRAGSETNRFADIPVYLLDVDSNVVASVTTGVSGAYAFTNLAPAYYFVRFDLSALSTNDFQISPANQGTNVFLDSDVVSGSVGSDGDTAVLLLYVGQHQEHVDLGLIPPPPTWAAVAEVWGEWTGGEGRVVWRTGSEWSTAGFFVYRLDPDTGGETRLNDVLVPSAFHETGAIYELADPEAAEGRGGTYRIEEVELSGNAIDLGAHDVVFGPPPAAAKAARAEARAAKAAVPVKSSAMKLAGPSRLLKVLVRDEGLYGVELQAIAGGMGLSIEDVQALAEAGSLEITEQGAAVPAIYDAARARLVFHARGADDWYARDNAYLISEGAGAPMPRRAPGAASGETAVPAQVRFELDRYPFDSALVKPADFYYWDYVLSATNDKATSLRNFPLDLTGAAGDVALNVRLSGWSSTTNDPDHLAEFRFNGGTVGSVAFDGQAAVETELSIPAASVAAGENVLAVRGVLQPGRSHSYFIVDWIEASFIRELVPLAGTAHFGAGAAPAISAAAFAAPLAVALDAAGNPTWIADGNGALPAKAWAAAEGDARFAVAEADGLPLLAPEPVAADPWFRSETNRIDYLVLTSRALEPAARELADYRAGQGLRVGVATFEDVCDWMAGGLRTPEAIPELLAYAAATWTEAPWMVVLAGSGHYDYLNALSNEVNHLPPMLIETLDGLYAADGALAELDGDEWPDLAIGRLPARTTNELAAMIAKIRATEAEFGSAWQNQWLLAADVPDAAGDFTDSNDRLAALAGEKYPVTRIDLATTAIAPARAALTNGFKAGSGFIHYTGHGGFNYWSTKNLLKATDVNVMANARKPVVVALSCLVGRFEAPGVDSLAELLMRRAQGGSVAVWAPSGMSRNAPATALAEAFYRSVLQDGSGTLGLAVLRARRSLEANLATQDTLATYNLLGDPALRIAGNVGGHAADENFAQWRWQRFAPAELADPETGGATAANFFDYAMAGGAPVLAELPEFGFPLPGVGEMLPRAGEDGGVILRWKRRIQRADVEYRLFISENLEQWEAEPADMEIVGVEPDPDGVMETVRTRVNRPWAERVFINVQARKK
jgi:uncharacterized repeat protein (TIGR01451 family)